MPWHSIKRGFVVLTYVFGSVGWNVGTVYIVGHCDHRDCFIFKSHGRLFDFFDLVVNLRYV